MPLDNENLHQGQTPINREQGAKIRASPFKDIKSLI